jgi:HEXXH motif-containing protein
MDPEQILWSDTSWYAARFEKSAAALVAVERTVTGDAAAETAEFSRLFTFVAEASAEHFTKLWNDPMAYYWVRRAVHFLAAVRGAPMGRIELAYCADVGAAGPREALCIHLADFSRFALALAILSGRELALAEPYTTTLPLALPGTQLVINGSGCLSIHGVTPSYIDATYKGERIRLPIADDATSPSTPHIAPCPFVDVGGVRIPLNPALFRLPGIGLSSEWTEPASDFQKLHSGALSDALSLVASFQPQNFAQFPQGLRSLALKPMREGTFSSLSSSELPGAFICSVPCDRYELAATLIHEFHHNRLFYVEESGAFFEEEGEDPIDGENHYSPWRDGPRPLHGLFHSLYVYLPVFRFWSAVVCGGQLVGIQLAYAKDQLGRIPFQLRIGVNQLQRHAKFTSFGSLLFEQMAAETIAAEHQVRALGISLDLPATSLRANGAFRPVVGGTDARELTIGETLRNHLEKADRLGECEQERQLLDRQLSPGHTPRR